MKNAAFFGTLIFFGTVLQAQLTHHFEKIAETPDASPTDITTAPGGVLYIAQNNGGLSATTFDTDSFGPVINIDDGPWPKTVAAGWDNLVFSANSDDGLRVLTYDDTAFTHVDDIKHNTDGVMDFAQDVAVGPDSTIFVANYGEGLRAYTFDGESLTSTALIKDGLYATAVAVGADSIVFAGLGVQGLWAYTYDDTSFTNITSIDESRGYISSILIANDSTIFVANSEDGLRAYSFDGVTFTNTAHMDSGGSALDLAMDSQGIIYLANSSDGIRAFTYDGSSFTNTAHLNTLTNCEGIAVDSQDNIFADALTGMGVYRYTLGLPIVGVHRAPDPEKNLQLKFAGSLNSPFYYELHKTEIIHIGLYSATGQLLQVLANGYRSQGTYSLPLETCDWGMGIYLLQIRAGREVYSQKIRF